MPRIVLQMGYDLFFGLTEPGKQVSPKNGNKN
jgi:hypothetical protein